MHPVITNKENIEGSSYKRLVKAWLLTILLILPFQITISSYIVQWSEKLATIVNNLDEITIVVFMMLSFVQYIRDRKLPDKAFFFYYHLFFFSPYADCCPDFVMETPPM